MRFAFLTKDGKATAPGNPLQPEHFVPDLKRDYLMNPGDLLRLHLSASANGFRVTVDDLNAHTSGVMTASAANGFGSVRFQPKAKTCRVQQHGYSGYPQTSTPRTPATSPSPLRSGTSNTPQWSDPTLSGRAPGPSGTTPTTQTTPAPTRWGDVFCLPGSRFNDFRSAETTNSCPAG